MVYTTGRGIQSIWVDHLFITEEERLYSKRVLKLLDSSAAKDLLYYPDKNQVELDLMRSFVHFEGLNTAPRKVILRHRKKLSRIMDYVFIQDNQSSIHYYQGFHDICSVLCLALDEKDACIAAERLALYHLNDFMHSSMDSVFPYLNFVYFLLSKIDPDLYKWIMSSGTPPYFSLSWILTWFSHDLSKLSDIYLIFDLILHHHPLMPIFLTVVMIHMNRKVLLDMDITDEIFHGKLYQTLSKLPLHTDIKQLCSRCMDIFMSNSEDSQSLLKRKISLFYKSNDRDFQSIAHLPKFPPISQALEISKAWIALKKLSKQKRAVAFSKRKFRHSYRYSIQKIPKIVVNLFYMLSIMMAMGSIVIFVCIYAFPICLDADII
jgi:hypothetical protein